MSGGAGEEPAAVITGAGSLSEVHRVTYPAAITGQGSLGAAPIISGEARTVVTLIGASGTFGSLAAVTETPSGHSFSVKAIEEWAFGAGLCVFYTRTAPDGKIIMSTLPFTQNELKPTMDHAEVCFYDPVAETFTRIVIPTSAGARKAVSPSTGLGGTDAGAGDIAVAGKNVLLTCELGYNGWNIPQYGQYPAFAFLSEIASQWDVQADWEYNSSLSLTGDQWHATDPSRFESVIAPNGQTAGNGASYWSPQFPGQMAVLPASGNIIVGHYFGFGLSGSNAGGISVIDTQGKLQAAYQIPNMTPLSGTLTLAAVRDVEADPASMLNAEYFCIIYDQFGAGVKRTFQIFMYNQSTQAISPVSVPCCPGDTNVVGIFAIFDSEGNLFISTGQDVSGLGSLNAGNLQVYLKHGPGQWNPTMQAPVFSGWETASWPTPVAADLNPGFTQAQGAGSLAGPPQIDPVSGAYLLAGSTSLLAALPAAGGISGGLGPNLLPAFTSDLSPPELLTPDDSVFATSLGSWVPFLGSATRAAPPVTPPQVDGVTPSHAMKMQEAFGSLIFNTRDYTGILPNTPYQFKPQFLADTGSPPRTCEAWIQWKKADGTVISSSAVSSVTDNTSAWEADPAIVTSPPLTAKAVMFVEVVSAASGEFHWISSNSLYCLDAGAAGWTGFVTGVQLEQLADQVWALAMTAQVANENPCFASASIAVMPYQEYFLSSDFRAAAGQPSQQVQAEFRWEDADGDDLGTGSCTFTQTDNASSWVTPTCGAMAPANAATASIALIPVMTSIGEKHYARNIRVQEQPFTAIPPVNYEISVLRGQYPAVSTGRPSVSGGKLHIPVATCFTAAENAAYDAGGYIPAPKPQFLAAIDLAQILPEEQSVMPSADSLLIAGVIELLGDLPTISGIPGAPSAGFTLDPGFSFGAPQPLVDIVQSLITDGEMPYGTRASNRTMTLPVSIRAASRLELAAAKEYLLGVIDLPFWQLQWTRADAATPVIFDCFRAEPSQPEYDLNSDQQFSIGIKLTFQALPYARSAVQQFLPFQNPVSGFPSPPSPVTIDTFSTVTGSQWVQQSVSGPFGTANAAVWSPGAFAFASYSRTFSVAFDISPESSLTFWTAFKADGTVIGQPVPSQVTFFLSLTDVHGNVIQFGKAQKVTPSLITETGIAWNYISVPVTQVKSGFDYANVKSYTIQAMTTLLGLQYEAMYLADVIDIPLSTQLVSSVRGAVYRLDGILGSVHAPVSMQFQPASGVSVFGTLIVHRPGADAPVTLVPFTSVGNGADQPDGTHRYLVQSLISGINARFNGTYSVMLVAGSWSSPSSSRTVTVTFYQYPDNTGSPATDTVSRTFTPSADAVNGMISIGEITLPVLDIAPDNTQAFFKVAVTDTITSDRFLDVLFLDTMGETVRVNTSGGQFANIYIDEPTPDRDIGRVLASTGDRSSAYSLLGDQQTILSGGPLTIDPGSSLLLAYCIEGPPAIAAWYYPRFYLDTVI